MGFKLRVHFPKFSAPLMAKTVRQIRKGRRKNGMDLCYLHGILHFVRDLQLSLSVKEL